MPTYTGSLTTDGPLVTLAFGISASEHQRRVVARMPIPLPFHGRALVDSGTPFTVADAQLIASLQIQPFTMQATLASASGLRVNKLPLFDMSVSLLDDAGQQLHHWPRVRVIGASYPSSSSIQGLLGRDLLDSCVFIYDGKQRTFTLDI